MDKNKGITAAESWGTTTKHAALLTKTLWVRMIFSMSGGKPPKHMNMLLATRTYCLISTPSIEK